MYSAIRANKRNTVIIMMVFLLLIGGLGALAGYLYDDYFITGIVLFIAIIYALIEYFAASRMAISMAGGREIKKQDNPTLWNVVENLAIANGQPMPRVFIIDDPSPNAFATGRNPQHSYVAATTGLLQLMDKRELTGVMAHEMSHAKGVGREDEANIVAYALCLNADDDYLNYCALLDAATVLLNSLPRERAEELYARLDEEVRQEYSRAAAHYAAYEGPIDALSSFFNDLFLKANGVASGTRSYGETVNALVALIGARGE